MEYLGLSSMERRRARQLLRSGEPLSEQEAEASKLNRAALGLGVHNFVFSMVMLGGFVGFTVYEGLLGAGAPWASRSPVP